ncbi:MAG: catalase [Chthoniobacteraceae bacterium]
MNPAESNAPAAQRLTTAHGIPVSDNQNSSTAGRYGPVLLTDFHLIEKLAHFNRERIPERVVHAKGAGAYGYLEITSDVRHLTKAAPFQELGKRTPCFLRFSTVGGEKGSADAERDPRGFALKMYTEDGNWDIVGNNTPVFFIRDPLKFPDFIHTQKRNPATNCKDANMVWDFWSLVPESTHQVTILFSDRGTPSTYRHMNGYGSHTYAFVNAEGKRHWVKFHFKTRAGISNFKAEEAVKMCGEDADHATRDLFNHIGSGQTAEWDFQIQVMTEDEAATYRFDPFDVTKVWPHADFPCQTIGRLVLDRNPRNYFAEVEQAAFAPSNVIPGIDLSPDKMLQGRVFAYADAHRYRLGVNYTQIPVNCPFATRGGVANHQRDGFMYSGAANEAPNYEPNSFDGIKESPEAAPYPHPVAGVTGHQARNYQQDDFVQAGDLYRLMSEEEKSRLVANIVGSLSKVERKDIQLRAICNFYRADADYGTRIAKGLIIDVEAEMASLGSRPGAPSSASVGQGRTDHASAPLDGARS